MDKKEKAAMVEKFRQEYGQMAKTDLSLFVRLAVRKEIPFPDEFDYVARATGNDPAAMYNYLKPFGGFVEIANLKT